MLENGNSAAAVAVALFIMAPTRNESGNQMTAYNNCTEIFIFRSLGTSSLYNALTVFNILIVCLSTHSS